MAGGTIVLTIIRYFGAFMIIVACAGVGFCAATSHRREENTLKKLIAAIDYMTCELQFRMLALPDLCRKTANECDGILRQVFYELAVKLEDINTPEVKDSLDCVLKRTKNIPYYTKISLQQLGNCLGRFDLEGQLKGLKYVRNECRNQLSKLSNNSETRTRSYQTLGLCAGAALVILLI